MKKSPICGLSDVDSSKNDGLNWRIAEPTIPLFHYHHFEYLSKKLQNHYQTQLAHVQKLKKF